jgi:hypothetical protein
LKEYRQRQKQPQRQRQRQRQKQQQIPFGDDNQKSNRRDNQKSNRRDNDNGNGKQQQQKAAATEKEDGVEGMGHPVLLRLSMP